MWSEGEYLCQSDVTHKEIFITDYEWMGQSLFNVGEYDSPWDMNDDVGKLSELNPLQQKAVVFLPSQQITYDIDDAIGKADDVIIHENQTLEDMAYSLLQECYELDKLPPIISNNID
ncbi:MAG: antirestriction protein ArdA [Campylobacteraceae bacterium]|nr:antirestriction protein ArdA [Campylobacteraceae bacterium]